MILIFINFNYSSLFQSSHYRTLNLTSSKRPFSIIFTLSDEFFYASVNKLPKKEAEFLLYSFLHLSPLKYYLENYDPKF